MHLQLDHFVALIRGTCPQPGELREGGVPVLGELVAAAERLLLTPDRVSKLVAELFEGHPIPGVLLADIGQVVDLLERGGHPDIPDVTAIPRWRTTPAGGPPQPGQVGHLLRHLVRGEAGMRDVPHVGPLRAPGIGRTPPELPGQLLVVQRGQ